MRRVALPGVIPTVGVQTKKELDTAHGVSL